MVRAWYIEGDAQQTPQDENHRHPPKFVTLEELRRTTGAEYFPLDVNSYESEGSLEKIRKSRGYGYEDEFSTPASNQQLQKFFTEHFHAEEEIRFILEGCAYFDLKDKNDEWVRVEVVPGDLIVVPSGCYHRLALDKTNTLRMKRLFLNDPVYKAYPRPEGQNMDCRKDYLKKLHNGTFIN